MNEEKVTTHSFILFGMLVRWTWCKDGWWMTDGNGFRNTLIFSLNRITFPDGCTGYDLTTGPLLVQWAQIAKKTANH